MTSISQLPAEEIHRLMTTPYAMRLEDIPLVHLRAAELLKEQALLMALLKEAVESGALQGVNQECCGYGVQTSYNSPPECCCDPHDLEYRIRVAINHPWKAEPFVVEDAAMQDRS